MLNRLKNLLTQPLPEIEKGSERNVIGLTLAVCVVLMEIAQADDEFTDDERDHVVETLKVRFTLSTEEAEELILDAEQAREESLDLWRFTNRVNEALDKEQKQKVLLEVWRVIYADGTLDSHEDYLVHKLARLFNLQHSDLIEAKAS
jgi:uncharacterized tellurite resistance protein B-like protein